MTTREEVMERVNKRLADLGLSSDFVNTHTLYELEEYVGLGHFKYSGPSEEQTGHILLSTHYEDRLKEAILSNLA